MYLITNRHLCSEDRYIEVIKEASYSGVKYIILREKDLCDEELIKLYYNIKEVVNEDSKIIINNNIDVFEKVNADGLHLSYNSYLKFYDDYLRGNLDKFKNKLIGVSTHSLDEVKEVDSRYANYVFLSHIYETKCKEGLDPKGLAILKDAKYQLKNSNLDLIALGGILPSNSKETLKYCNDIAIMSTLFLSEDVSKTINEYYS